MPRQRHEFEKKYLWWPEYGSIDFTHIYEDPYLISSRMKMTKKFYPYFIPTVFVFSMSQAFRILLLDRGVRGFITMCRVPVLGFLLSEYRGFDEK